MKAKYFFTVLLLMLLSLSADVMAQCSVCTRTAEQLGDGPAKGLNAGILYLAFTPLVIAGVIGFRWWKTNKDEMTHDVH